MSSDPKRGTGRANAVVKTAATPKNVAQQKRKRGFFAFIRYVVSFAVASFLMPFAEDEVKRPSTTATPPRTPPKAARRTPVARSARSRLPKLLSLPRRQMAPEAATLPLPLDELTLAMLRKRYDTLSRAASAGRALQTDAATRLLQMARVESALKQIATGEFIVDFQRRELVHARRHLDAESVGSGYLFHKSCANTQKKKLRGMDESLRYHENMVTGLKREVASTLEKLEAGV